MSWGGGVSNRCGVLLGISPPYRSGNHDSMLSFRRVGAVSGASGASGGCDCVLVAAGADSASKGAMGSPDFELSSARVATADGAVAGTLKVHAAPLLLPMGKRERGAAFSIELNTTVR